MRFKLAFTLTAVALIGLTASLLAQQPGGQRGPGGPGGRGFGGGFGQSRMSLLRIAEIRKELELADEQVAAIEKIDQELREKYPFGGGRGGPGGPGGRGGDGQKGRRGGNGEGALIVPTQWYFVQQNQNQNQQGQGRRGGNFQPPTPEEQARMEQQRLERAREERAKLAEILLPQQIKRLNEIFVQQNGTGALQDEEIAKELGINDAQKAKLAEVQQANRDAMAGQMREFFQLDDNARRAKFEELRKANDAKVLAVLSGDQQKKFEEMKGKPFAMPEGAGRGGPGGPGGPGGRNRGKGGNNN